MRIDENLQRYVLTSVEDDTLRIISEEGEGRLRGVFHCFTGDQAAADRALATGFFLSIPGVATFPKAEALRQAAAAALSRQTGVQEGGE